MSHKNIRIVFKRVEIINVRVKKVQGDLAAIAEEVNGNLIEDDDGGHVRRERCHSGGALFLIILTNKFENVQSLAYKRGNHIFE
jgi:hypothetical protein